jgi:hypothetical protein
MPCRLIRVTDNIQCTRYAYYDSAYKNKTRTLIHFLSGYVEHVIDILRLDLATQFVIKPMNLRIAGLFALETGMVYMNVKPNLNLHTLRMTLSHEAIHVKQAQDGRLTLGPSPEVGYAWDGVPFPAINILKEIEEYTEQPWELDVEERLPQVYSELLRRIDL